MLFTDEEMIFQDPTRFCCRRWGIGGKYRAATTENPSFSVVATLSRSLISQLRPLTAEDTRAVGQRAIDDPAAWAGQSR